jgi:flagellar biosynthetic protein FliO
MDNGSGAKFGAVIFFLFAASSIGYALADNTIGTFDIEKVRKAASESGYSLGEDSAAGAASVESSSARKSDGIGWVAIRLSLYLALIVGAIFVVIWVIKRLGLAGGSKIGGGSMDVLEALPVGQNRTIMLVRVRDIVYVLAQTQHQITLLDKVEGDRALEVISSSKGAVSISQFKDVFNDFMGRIKKPF